MRVLFFILSFFFCTISFADIAKKIVLYDEVTKKPITKQYFHILKDNDLWVTIEKTNTKGVSKFDVWWKYDSSATYQIDINAKGYRKHRQTINLLDEKTVKIGLTPDTNALFPKPNMIYEDCFGISFGDYYPFEPSSLNDLPNYIREKLEAHLQERLGSFYENLRFSGGQIVDLNRLYNVYEKARDFKWTPYSYYLCFSFADTTNGISMFTAKIVLDGNGNVIEEIQLPSFKNYPEKSKIISLYEATRIAKTYDFNNPIKEIKFYYNKDLDGFVWCISKITNDNGLTFGIETLVLNANTGEKIVIRHSGEIR